MPQRILALEIDAHELKAAVLESTFRDYRIVGFYREPVAAADGTLSEQVRKFLAHHHLQATTVLTSLPGDLVTWRTFFLPFRDRKRLDQTVPFELETQVPFGLDEIIVDYHVLHRDSSGCSVLAGLVQRHDLEAHLAVFSAAGLDPKVVDIAPLAALNVLNLLGSDLPETFAYIGGTARGPIVAFYRNRRLVGLRTLNPARAADAEHVEAAAAGNGQVDATHVATLIGDIRWSLLALNGAPLDAGLPCFIAGEGVLFDQLAQDVRTALDFSVQRLAETPLRNLPAALRSEVTDFCGPLGLALREVAPDSIGLNFRRNEFAYHRGQDELRYALWRSGALAALIVLLMMTSTYMDYQQLARRAELIQAEVRSVFSQTLPDVRPKTDEERVRLQAEIDAAQKRLQLLHTVAPPGGATAVDVLRTITAAIPDTLKIDIDEYVMDTEGVRIKAKTDSFEMADAIKQQVQNTHYFSDVQVKDVKTAGDGKGVDFRLMVFLGKEGAGAPAKQ